MVAMSADVNEERLTSRAIMHPYRTQIFESLSQFSFVAQDKRCGIVTEEPAYLLKR